MGHLGKGLPKEMARKRVPTVEEGKRGKRTERAKGERWEVGSGGKPIDKG